MNKNRGRPAVRVTLEFRPLKEGEFLCFDDAHGDFGPSALTNAGDLIKGMLMHVLELKMLAILSHSKQAAKIPKHHTKKRRDAKTLHDHAMRSYDTQEGIIREAIKTAKYDVITNWNWGDSTEEPS